MKIKTQRHFMRFMGDVTFYSTESDKTATPVLVVPEDAVKGCKHEDRIQSGDAEVCVECGAWRARTMFGNWIRWQRPRILRVGRAKK